MKILLLMIILGSLVGCSVVDTTDLSKNSKYNSMINKDYKTNVDLAVFTYQDNKKEYIVDAFGKEGLPKSYDEIKNEKFPIKHESYMIYGYLLQGTIIKVIKVERLKNFEVKMISTTAEVVSEGKFKGWKVNVSSLMKVTEVPEIRPNYIQEVK
jgi:uncharacterized protein YceK